MTSNLDKLYYMTKIYYHGVLSLVLAALITSDINAQTYFKVNEYSIDLTKYPAYSETEIQKAISNVKSSEFFDYNYLNSGCNFKAHYISLWLKKKFNITTFKIWNFSKGNYYYSGSNDRLMVNDPNKLTEDGNVYWGFHNAVGILLSKKIKKKITIDTVVIDLAIDDKIPVKLNNWLAFQNQTNTYWTFTEQKYCNFESIIPGIQNIQTNRVERLTGSYNIFAGNFWDDAIAVSNGQVAKALATDIIVMKYYNQIVLADNMIQQMSQSITQIRAQSKQVLGYLSESDRISTLNKMEEKTTKMIIARRLELTKPISDYNNLKLPEFYQKQIEELIPRIQAHIIELKK